VGEHHLARIGFGLGPGEPELFRRPGTEHAVAPCRRLELELLVVRELLLEAFLALVKGGHRDLSGRAGSDGNDLAYRGKMAKSTRRRRGRRSRRKVRGAASLCSPPRSARFPAPVGQHVSRESCRPRRRGPRIQRSHGTTWISSSHGTRR